MILLSYYISKPHSFQYFFLKIVPKQNNNSEGQGPLLALGPWAHAHFAHAVIRLCWSNISPAGSGTAKLSWKERLLALHFQEEVFTTSFPCFPGHMFFLFFFFHILYIALCIFYIIV